MLRARLLLTTSLIAAPLALFPQASHADPMPPDWRAPVMDKVMLDLAVEDWVETATARVVISVDAAVPGSDAGKVRGEMMKAVSGLVSGGDWRFSGYNRSQDQSGLERSHAELEARLKESDLGGLADRAKQASKPGIQLRVQEIDFTPTLAETEAMRAKLRNEIYDEVNDELKRLAAAEPDRKFRMATINFGQREARPMMQVMQGMAKAGTAMGEAAPAPMDALSEGENAAPITVEQKMQVQAHVVLEAVAPKE